MVEEETGHVILETPGFQLVVVAIPAAIAKDIVIAAPPIRRGSTPIKLVFPVPGFEDARRLAQHLGGAVNGPEREWEFRGARICDGWDPEGTSFNSAGLRPACLRALARRCACAPAIEALTALQGRLLP